MSMATEARAALYTRGNSLGIHKNLLLSPGSGNPSKDHVAEAFEAILGAVYVDAGHNLTAVKEVIASTGLDTHQFLQADKESQDAQEQKELAQFRASEARVRMQEKSVSRMRRTEKRQRTREINSQQQSLADNLQLEDDKSEAVVQDLRPALSPDKATTEPPSPLIRYPGLESSKAHIRGLDQGRENHARAHSKLSADGNLLSNDYSKPVQGVSLAEALQASPASHVDRKEDVQIPSEPDSQTTQAVAEAGSDHAQHLETYKPWKQEARQEIEKALKNDAWISAETKARKLTENGQPTDVQALYETLVAQTLENENKRVGLLREAARRAAAQDRMEQKLKDDAWIAAKKRARRSAKEGKPTDVQALYQRLADNAVSSERKRVARTERELRRKVEALAVARSEILEAETTPIQLQSPSTSMPQPKETTQASGRKEAQTGTQAAPRTLKDSAETQDHASTTSQHGSSTAEITSSEAQEAPASPLVQAAPRLPGAEKPVTSDIAAYREREEESQDAAKSVDQLEKDIIDSHNDAWEGAGAIASATSRPNGAGRKQPRNAEKKEKVKPKNKLQMKLDEADTNTKSTAGFEIYESEVDRMMGEISKDDNDQGIIAPATCASVEKPAFDFSFEKPLQSTEQKKNTNVMTETQSTNDSTTRSQPEQPLVDTTDVYPFFSVTDFSINRIVPKTPMSKMARKEARRAAAQAAFGAAQARALLTGNAYTESALLLPELPEKETDEQRMTRDGKRSGFIRIRTKRLVLGQSHDDSTTQTEPLLSHWVKERPASQPDQKPVPEPSPEPSPEPTVQPDRELFPQLHEESVTLAGKETAVPNEEASSQLETDPITEPKTEPMLPPNQGSFAESFAQLQKELATLSREKTAVPNKEASSQPKTDPITKPETEAMLQPNQELLAHPKKEFTTLSEEGAAMASDEEANLQPEKELSAQSDTDSTAQSEQESDAQPVNVSAVKPDATSPEVSTGVLQIAPKDELSISESDPKVSTQERQTDHVSQPLPIYTESPPEDRPENRS
jgi:hypothetical protein